ncbi:MAG TPA: class I SAM-dependent methyltransferase [Ktedonobacteraceae bacterium]
MLIQHVQDVAHLTNRAPLLIHTLGGLLPGMPYENRVKDGRVLEVACGPGVWMLSYARTYPEAQVVGIDCRRDLVNYAEKRFREQQVSQRVSAYPIPSFTDRPFPFFDESFDIISLSCGGLLLQMAEWPFVLKECLRVLRKGGSICITDFDLPQSNAPALEDWNTLFWQVLQLLGQRPQTDLRFGWLYELEPLVSLTGFRDGTCIPHVVNFSYGAPLHKDWTRDLLLLVKKYLPIAIEMELISQSQSSVLQKRIQQGMDLPTFHAIQYFLSVWGRKDY